METDYEIALAVRGKQHPDANTLYHPVTSSTSSLNFSTAAIAKATAAVNNNQHHRTNSAASFAVAVGVAAQAFSDQKSALEDEGDSGTTACIVMITPTSIICANAGDSRAVFARRTITPTTTTTTTEEAKSPDESTPTIQEQNMTHENNNKAIALSYDHKPEDDSEERRIRAAGSYVANGRVEGDLAVSRGLGDFRFKQMAIVLNNTQLYPENTVTNNSSNNRNDQHMATDDEGGDESDDDNNKSQQQQQVLMQPGTQKVSPIPDLICHTRQHNHDEYIVVACDGIWDVVNNQQCIHAIDTIMYVEGEKKLGLISEEVR